MRREDVDALAAWGRHDEPLFRHYNVPALSALAADELWAYLAGSPAERRPYAGVEGERVVASLILRQMDHAAGSAELGIILDPACMGRGLGRRILESFAAVLAGEGFRRLRLEVAGYNERAIAAYRAAGFTVLDEYWAEPEPGIEIAALPDREVRDDGSGRYRMRIVRMERRLTT
jgi:RimJ/RimL family protein N-acetyltransferase